MPRKGHKQLLHRIRLPIIRDLRRSRFGRFLASIIGGVVGYSVLYTLLFSLKLLREMLTNQVYVQMAIPGGAAACILLVTAAAFYSTDPAVSHRLLGIALLLGGTSLLILLAMFGGETSQRSQEPWDYVTGLHVGIIYVAASNVLAFFFRLELMMSNALNFFIYLFGFSMLFIGLWGIFSAPHRARAFVIMIVGLLIVRKLIVPKIRDNNTQGD
jgi:hypothetical protein